MTPGFSGADTAIQPQRARATLDEFKEFLTDLADLSIDEPVQTALLAAREYIAEDDTPKSNRVLGLIHAALTRPDDSPKPCSHPRAEVWFYRDDDTYMRCPDCKSKWVGVNAEASDGN